jgi:ketosteroid isomerase-like protein
MAHPSSVEATVRGFVDLINAHDARAIVARCTADHALIDSLGVRLSGSSQLRQAWETYFALFPDYRVEIEDFASSGNSVLLSGWASATHAASGAKWRIPAAWRALVTQDRVAQWQVYADNGPVYRILGG